MTLMVEETREKDYKRKQNIIIANLPESSEVTLEERKREVRDSQSAGQQNSRRTWS